MRYILYIILSSLIFLSGCLNLPEDLQSCKQDSDCTLVDSYLITKKLCQSDSINVKYEEWYTDQLSKKDPYNSGDINCSPSPPSMAVCLESKCSIQIIR